MYDLLKKFDFAHPTLGPDVWLAMGGIWLIVLVCTLTSIWGRPFRWRARLLWSLLVIALPLVGVVLYLPFSLKDDIYPYVGFWRRPRQ